MLNRSIIRCVAGRTTIDRVTILPSQTIHRSCAPVPRTPRCSIGSNIRPYCVRQVNNRTIFIVINRILKGTVCKIIPAVRHHIPGCIFVLPTAIVLREAKNYRVLTQILNGLSFYNCDLNNNKLAKLSHFIEPGGNKGSRLNRITMYFFNYNRTASVSINQIIFILYS